MKKLLIAAVFIISVCVIPAKAMDYTVDLTFDPWVLFPGHLAGQSINDIYVQPDGKVVVGGAFDMVHGEALRMLVRVNPDGTRDTTFNSALTTSSMSSYVLRIRPLPDGKLLVIGRFNAAGQLTHYAKLNADGSLDNSMPERNTIGTDVQPLPDGKFIVCGGLLINSESYEIAHRLNADGSIDPTFRVTFSQGTCSEIQLVADGKLLIGGAFHNGSGVFYEPIQRFNSDGSHDPTFDAELPSGSGGPKFAVQSDGKIILSYEAGASRYVQRFGSNGNLETTFANCNGTALLPRADGTTLVGGCRKWPTGPLYQFASIVPNGTIATGLDQIPFDGPPRGFRDAGGGKYYAYGQFTMIDAVTRAKIVRLMPYSVPVRAKFDFDNDGKSDHSVWRPSDAYWYLYRSTTGPAYLPWGVSSDLPVAHDYDGDGKTDIGIFRDGVWHMNGSLVGYRLSFLGGSGDKPILGSFNGRSTYGERAVRRTQGGTVSWLVNIDGSGSNYNVGSIDGEIPTDVPIIGDFDGDSRDELGYFRNGLWVSKDYLVGAPVITYGWGVAGDIPVAEDYDGDGQTDYAIYRPSTGVWWINRSTAGLQAVSFGVSSDIPVPADYDGDGKTDIAIYRDGQWWQISSSTGNVSVVNWGAAGDIPIPAQTR